MPGRASRLYLVDGSGYIYRAFFALPPLTGPNGQPTNAVYGFTTMLLKLLNEVAPEYLGVVFDAPGKTFRDDLFADYKANRPSTPPDLSAQIDCVHQIVAGFRVPELTLRGVEADDVIATVIDRLAPTGIECVVITADKDLMQLVGPRVRLWDTMRDRWTDEAAVESRFGVKPAQVVDVLALMGDSVDNIPGIKGIGEKTAMALIQAFGDVEGLLSHLDDLEKMKLRGAKGIAERAPEEPLGDDNYVAAVDLSGGTGEDSAALAIGHCETDEAGVEFFILDVLREWMPPFDPGVVVAEIATECLGFDITEVTGDQFSEGFAASECRRHGLLYRVSPRKTGECLLDSLVEIGAGGFDDSGGAADGILDPLLVL